MHFMIEALFGKRQATSEPTAWAGTVGSSTYYLRPAETGNTPSASSSVHVGTGVIFQHATQAQASSASPTYSSTSQQQQAWTPSPTLSPSPTAETQTTWQAPSSSSTPWTPSSSSQQDKWTSTPPTPTQNWDTWQAASSTSVVITPVASSSNAASNTINTAVFSAVATVSTSSSALFSPTITADGSISSAAGIDANTAAAAQTPATADTTTPVFAKLSKPAIAGIIAGVLILLAIAVGVGIFWRRKRAAGRDDDSSERIGADYKARIDDGDTVMEILTTSKGRFRDDASIASFGPAHGDTHRNGGVDVYSEKNHRSRQDGDEISIYSADGDFNAERPTSDIYVRPGISPRKLTPEYNYDPANRPSFGWQRNNAFSSSSEHLTVQPAWDSGLDRSRSVRNVSGGLGPGAY